MARNSALFKRIKCFLPFYVRKTFYFAYIQPIFDYCSVIWGPGRCIQKILKLQRRFIRMMVETDYSADTEPILKALRILPLTNLIDVRICGVVYRALNNLTPEYSRNMFKLLSSVSQRCTRQTSRGDLFVPHFKLIVARNSVSYLGPVLYNKLSSNIRTSVSVYSFTRSISNKYTYDSKE